MKRLIFGALLLVAMLSAANVSAQMKTSYFMEGSYFRTEMNPALAPTRGYIALPIVSGFSGGLYSNMPLQANPLYGDMMLSSEQQRHLPNLGLTSIRSTINVLGVGFYTRNQMFWNFGVNLRQDNDVYVSKDVYNALGDTATGTFHFDNLCIDNTELIDAYVGTAFAIGEHVTFGVRAKFLVGLGNINAVFDSVVLNNGRIENIVGRLRMNSPEYDNSGYDGTDDSDIYWSDEQGDVWSNMKSFGGAIDLGVEVALLNDHLKISAAVTDFGFMRWARTSHISGNLDVDDSFIVDAPEKLTGYTTRLTCNFNAGVEYNFCNNHFALGLLSHTRFYSGGVASELTASFNIRPTNWMTLTASHTLLNGNKPGVFGAAINIHPCGINIFAGMDYVATKYVGSGLYPFALLAWDQELMIPRNAKSMNLYLGVGFNLARPKYVREAE